MVEIIRVALLGDDSLIREALRVVLNGPQLHVTQIVEEPSMIAIGMSEDMVIVIQASESSIDWSYVDRLRALLPLARVVIIDDYASCKKVMFAFSIGIDGYIINNIPPCQIVELIQVVHMGHKLMPSYVIDALANAGLTLQDAPIFEISSLSLREREILSCLGAGSSNKVIARQLSISEATVKVHVKAVMRKLNVSNRTQAAVFRMTGCIDSGGQESNERPLLRLQ